jgi:hypothetical protein
LSAPLPRVARAIHSWIHAISKLLVSLPAPLVPIPIFKITGPLPLHLPVLPFPVIPGFRVLSSGFTTQTLHLSFDRPRSRYRGSSFKLQRFGRPILQRSFVQITRALASLKSSEFRVIGGSVLPSPARPYIHPNVTPLPCGLPLDHPPSYTSPSAHDFFPLAMRHPPRELPLQITIEGSGFGVESLRFRD